MTKQKNLSINFLIITIFAVIILTNFSFFNLTGVLGMSGYWASKGDDAIFAGMAFWQIASLLAGFAGVALAGAVWGAKWMIRQLGRRAFIGF